MPPPAEFLFPGSCHDFDKKEGDRSGMDGWMDDKNAQ